MSLIQKPSTLLGVSVRSHRPWLYLIFTFAISWTSWWTLAGLVHRGIVASGTPLFMSLFILGGLGPTIGAYASVVATRKEAPLSEYHQRLFRWRVNIAWYMAAFGLPFALTSLTVLLCATVEPNVLIHLAITPWFTLFTSFPIMVLFGGLEELGWRGVLQPELETRMSRFSATAIVAIIWPTWHIPLFFISGTEQASMTFATFAVGSAALAFLLAWLYANTKSILMCLIFHAAFNTAEAMGFSVPFDKTMLLWLTDVTGLLIGIGLVVSTPHALKRAG